jgi:2-polyprenyl-3-methyl-5-hydroxy-6-metoxy-1,4-benzoquinol methylase
VSVTKLIFESSAALVSELAFYGQTSQGWATYARFKTLSDIEQYVQRSPEYRDLQLFVDCVRPGRVLDVGAGYGITSAYLAIKGFDVVALEPSLRLCEDMDVFFRRFGLKIEVASGTAEAMTSLPGFFDAVVFYSSLNYCFDPERALVNARRLLGRNGVVFVCAPVLAFHRSKEWCKQLLKQKPRSAMHYGANEHIYRFPEYVGFLERAGFQSIEVLPSLKYRMAPKRAAWDSRPGYFLKHVYYLLMKFGCLNFDMVWKSLAKLSLLSTVLLAKKTTDKT